MIFRKDGRRELYNLDVDLGETTNVFSANTETATKLTTLMQRYIDEGRSTPGVAQKNDAALSITGGNKARKEQKKPSATKGVKD